MNQFGDLMIPYIKRCFTFWFSFGKIDKRSKVAIKEEEDEEVKEEAEDVKCLARKKKKKKKNL